MALFSGAQQDVNELLRGLLVELEIPAARYEDAMKHYKAVGEWLNAEGSSLLAFSPTIYAHGSFSIGTAVKPVGRDELDVDAVCLLSGAESIAPEFLKSSIGERLKSHERYSAMLDPREGGRRCWTLKYSEGTRFHLDVLPAIADDIGGLIAAGADAQFASHALRITNRSKTTGVVGWASSNPKGYAVWFRAAMRRVLDEGLVKAARTDASIEAVPEFEVDTPLQQLVKLLKYNRNVEFSGAEFRPSSIVLTTLAALSYRGERGVLDALHAVVPRMRELLFGGGVLRPVLNPVNPVEDFTDKWRDEPVHAQAFVGWLDRVSRWVDSLSKSRNLDLLNEDLRKSYGEKVATAALKRFVDRPLTAANSGFSPAVSIVAPHRQLPRWPFSTDLKEIKLSCFVGGRGGRLVLSGGWLSRNQSLTFSATGCGSGEIWWQVVNTGNEASFHNNLRGGFDAGESERTETTQYAGAHGIRCFWVKNDVCLGVSDEFVVRIR